MKRRSLIWCLTAAVICLHFSCVCPVDAATTQDKLEDAQEAYDDAQNKLGQAQSELEDLNEDKAELELALDELNSKLSTAAVILEELDKSITEKKNQIDATWGQVETLATQIEEIEALADEQYETAKAQIKYIYESGDTMAMIVLANSINMADYINRASYLQMFTSYQHKQLEALNQTSEALQSRRAEYENMLITLEEEKAELDSYEVKVAEQHDKINRMVDETAAQVETYKEQIADVEARIDNYEAKMSSQKDNIRDLESELAKEQETTEQANNSEWRDISMETYDEGDVKLLANLIYCEAGNEPYVGQVAVGAVVMNRVSSVVFPNTITGVIYQKNQFTPASSGRLALALARDSAGEECYKAARAALSGVNNIGECLYFRTPTSKVSPQYTIGGHIFY